jgi:uncharacterized phage infection (PIP) family protein YhgE
MILHFGVGEWYYGRGVASAQESAQEDIARANGELKKANAKLVEVNANFASSQRANQEFAEHIKMQQAQSSKLKQQRDAEAQRVKSAQKTIDTLARKAEEAQKSFDDLKTGALTLQADCALMMEELKGMKDAK